MVVESKDYEQHQDKKVTREQAAGMEPGDKKGKKEAGRAKKPSNIRKRKKQIKERTEPSETANLPYKCYLGGFDKYISYICLVRTGFCRSLEPPTFSGGWLNQKIWIKNQTSDYASLLQFTNSVNSSGKTVFFPMALLPNILYRVAYSVNPYFSFNSVSSAFSTVSVPLWMVRS